jgi:hypothetical protein
MKRLTTILGFFTLLLFAACSRKSPDIVQVLSFPVTAAVATDYQPPRTVDIGPLVTFLRGAEWSARTPSWKEPYSFSLHDGRVLTVDELTGVFAIKDVAGHFQIPQSKQKAFSEAVTAVIVSKKEPIQLPETTRGK